MSDQVKAAAADRVAKSAPTLPDVLGQILAKCDPGRVMELYYWSKEPGLLDIMRAIGAMPEASREALESFFALVGDPQSVAATWESSGRLALESRNLGETLAVARYLLGGRDAINRKTDVN